MTDQAVSPEADTPLIDPDELEAILAEVLDALVLSAGIDPEGPIAPEPGIEATALTGTIVIHADVEARLVIDADAQACAKLARCWGLVGPDGATGEDAADALGELCNLVGATAKSVFTEESFVGIPEVTPGTGPAWESVEVVVHHQTGVFTARLGRHEDQG